MSWADKAITKYRNQKRNEKIIDDIMGTEKYKNIRKEDKKQSVLEAYACFQIIAVAYLVDKLGFKKKRVEKFLAYAKEQMEFVEEYTDYFATMNTELDKEIGINVLKRLGMEPKEN